MAGSVFRPVLSGARVAIVAPSGPFRPEKVEPARAALTARGIRAGPGPASAAPEDGFLAGPDERRLASVVDALGDPDVAALWAARGGYGATRIARLVPLLDVRAAGKPLVGYSDATALLARWFAAGVGALHGPLATSVGGALYGRSAAFDAAGRLVVRTGDGRRHVFDPATGERMRD